MRLASRGQRDLDAGVEAIADAAERKRVRAQGLRVTVKSALAAAALTALSLLVP